ncbi:hypothetical protein C0995_004131 [Termitomyces sp. Mi166|nr:hypothetical protein C0995_004131 [Termitomyces sp. Mi166\
MSLYHQITSELPEEHAVFYSTRLPFLPVVTLDASGRPWGSILAGIDGKPGFVRNSRSQYSTLSINAKLWAGEPLLENVKRYRQDGSMLVAGIGVEYSTRRRSKFAGKVTKLEKSGDEIHLEFLVDEALGNCPKYITIRDLIPYPNISPTITSQNLDLKLDERLPDEAISLILESDTVFLGTTYAASADETSRFPSHLGMNQRGGRKGFIRVLPSDGRTVVLPDFSGNIEATPLASLTFISFSNGSILYLTGVATNLIGAAAHHIMPLHTQNTLTTIHVTGFTLVADALPIRQRPGSTPISSPYSPPVRLLAEEPGGATRIDDSTVLLTKIEMHSLTIATFSWTPSEKLNILSGQAAILDFTPLLGARGYQHMAPLQPTSVNDDRFRTWTVSSTNADGTFSLTMREKPGGAVTGALFNIARKLQEVRPELLEDARPMGLSVGLVGVTGDFVLPPSPKTELLWLAGGIGVTPFIAMLRSLNPAFEYDIWLILSVREPEVFIPLLSEALRARRSRGGKIVIDVFSDTDVPELVEESVVLRKHKGRVSREVLAASTGEDAGTSEKAVSLQEREAYVCGPPGFEAVLDLVVDLGLDRAKNVETGADYLSNPEWLNQSQTHWTDAWRSLPRACEQDPALSPAANSSELVVSIVKASTFAYPLMIVLILGHRILFIRPIRMSHPLLIPELLANIFTYSSKASNAVNAQEFPLKADWSSFLYHASLVRSLVYESQQEVLCALRFISDTRPVLDLFPGLHTLKIAPSKENWSLSLCSIFTHPGLKHLNIQCPSYKYEILPFTLPLSRLQGLTRFEIEGEQMQKIENSITALIHLPNLEILVIPPYLAGPQVLEAVSVLPSLQQLLSRGVGRRFSCDCEGNPVVPNFVEGCFPALNTITITGCADGLSAIVCHPHFPASIDKIDILPIACTTGCLTHFNKSLADTCTGITEYELYSELDEGGPSIMELRPLFSCRLRILAIQASKPLRFSQVEFRELASSLPDLEELFLNESPFKILVDESGAPGGITLDMLLSISYCCPKLKRFGVLLNTTQPSTEDVLHVVPFSDSLRDFDIGKSPLSLENLEGVAIFLAHVIPSHCEIVFHEDGADSQMWKTLASVLNALRKMKDLGRWLGEQSKPHGLTS